MEGNSSELLFAIKQITKNRNSVKQEVGIVLLTMMNYLIVDQPSC